MPDEVDLNGPDAKAKAKKARAAGGGLASKLVLALGFVLAAGAAGLGAAVGVVKFGGDLLPVSGAGHSAPAPVKATAPMLYAGIETAFTSNLVDTGRYLQVKISVGTTAGEAVVQAIKTHEPAVISAVLAVLGEAGEADVASREAKSKLALRVRDAINTVLRERGVAGAVDEVYFTSLVVQ